MHIGGPPLLNNDSDPPSSLFRVSFNLATTSHSGPGYETAIPPVHIVRAPREYYCSAPPMMCAPQLDRSLVNLGMSERSNNSRKNERTIKVPPVAPLCPFALFPLIPDTPNPCSAPLKLPCSVCGGIPFLSATRNAYEDANVARRAALQQNPLLTSAAASCDVSTPHG